MNVHQTPRRWLMSDERMGARLFEAIGRLRPGDGLLFRHHGLADAARAALGREVAAAAERVGAHLSVSRDVALARALGARWVHNPSADSDAAPGGLWVSRSVHDEVEATAARGAALAFISPVHPTASHPGQAVLGVARARMLAEMTDTACIALGGMDAARFAALGAPFIGWAGIDAFLREGRDGR